LNDPENSSNNKQTPDHRDDEDGRCLSGKFTVILRKEQEGGYTVQCVELPGAISEGDTKEALGNIREAIQGYLESFPEEEERLKLKKEILQVTI
jgi:predicted RNase H-like HicB family nuclease